MKTLKVFGYWNAILLLITIVLFIVSLNRQDIPFSIALGIIGLSELLMAFTGITSRTSK